MSVEAKEHFWREHQDTLHRIRTNLVSGRRSPHKSWTPPYGKRSPNARSKHPPYGKYRRSTPPLLPRLSTPPEHSERRSNRNLRKARYEEVPPVNPRQAFIPQEEYDSWGDDSDDEADDHFKPHPLPYPVYAPPAVVYGQPFPLYYPPPPKGSVRYQARRDRKRREKRDRLKIHPSDRRKDNSASPHKKGRRSRYGRNSVPAHRYPGPSYPPMHMLNAYVMPVHTVADEQEEQEEEESVLEENGPDRERAYRSPAVKTSPRRVYQYTQPLLANEKIGGDMHSFFIKHPLFAEDFVNWFITDCLGEEFVPDVLIDALQEVDKLPSEHPYFLPALRSCDDFLTQEIQQMIAEIVREARTEVARQNITPPPYVPLRDPLEVFLDDLVEVTVTGLCRDIVGETIRGLAHDYLEDVTTENILNDLIDDEIHDMRHELLDEAMFEIIASEFLEEHVIGPEVEEEAMVVATDMIKHYDNKVTRMEMKAVKLKSEDRLVDSLTLNYLLSLVARQGKVWTESDFANRFLDEMMGNMLLQQYFSVRSNRNKTIKCKPLRKLHEKVVTDVALDVLLQQLSSSLDEDLADVDEYERGVNDGILPQPFR